MNSKIWHNLDVKQSIKMLGADPNRGLLEREVSVRQTKFGKNELPDEKPLTFLKMFGAQFKSPLIYILLIAGIVTLALRDWTDAIIIFTVVFLNAGIGFFQENKTSKILQKLKKIVRLKTYVLREGNEKEIEHSELTPGDIFFLYPGNKVPADGRLIESHNLKINEAALTGEWVSNEKKTDVLPEKTPMADRSNMVYMGTIVEDGHGKAAVTGMGIDTEIGKIADTIKKTKEGKTPYQRKIGYLSWIIGVIIIFVCFLIFILGVINEQDRLQLFLTIVAVAVAAVPEGLPVAVTVILALGMQRILQKKGLVRRMVAAETLGSTSIICTDKTGTLTEAKMQVAGIYTDTKELLSDGKKYKEKIDKNSFASHIFFLKIATLCSQAFIENPDDQLEEWVVRGRPTERALLLAGIQAGLNKRELEREQPLIEEMPFSPVCKHSASLHKLSVSENILYILGAPEIIIKKSKFINIDGKEEKLSANKIKKLKEKYEELAGKGQRILAAAYKKTVQSSIFKTDLSRGGKSAAGSIMDDDFVLVGFTALHDPIREGVKEAIKICGQAGMRPIIITGDHKLTAKAVARELGLPANEENVIEGEELEAMNDDELQKRLASIEVYARVEPRQKLRIIRAWQEKGEVVAMTGDGINDSPALKRADIGLALGSGTDVAKEASDLILLTDNFSIIVAAVEEGRVIIDNIRKIITYLLSGGLTEIMLIGFALAFGLPLPILPGQILWKNMIESTPPAMALAFEPKERGIMERPPESPKTPLLTSEMNALIFGIGIISNIILFALFLWFLRSGMPLDLIRSMMFVGLAIDSFFVVFSCKNLNKNIWQYNPFDNRYLNITITFSFLMLLAALYFPVFQGLLKTVELGFLEWAILINFGILNLVLVEITKWIFISRGRKLRTVSAALTQKSIKR